MCDSERILIETHRFQLKMDHGNHMDHADHTSTDASPMAAHTMQMSMMQMTFNFSTDVTLLFDCWHPRNILGELFLRIPSMITCRID